MTIERPEGAGDPEFRFDMSSMGPALRAMDRLGMLSYGHEPPAWPKSADFGLTSADFVGAADGRVSETMRTYEAACRAVAAWHAEPPTGIPDHKIGGTNDGWIVTPAEIRAALAALAAQPEEAKAGTFAEHPRWDEWIDYLTRAAAHGGFRVE
ncbi:hypothetical protein [Kitasatospora sp. NPDC093679]|uniref:hypothetical protein n=1 Tax=Kitasatospora sp. NPDC093679 TaxID=3154983 RepID=UPI00343B1AF3